MSEENVELVRRLGAAFSRGSLDDVLAFFDPEITWHEDPSFPEAGVYRGIDAFERYAREFLAEFSEIHYEPQEVIDAGNDVVAHMRIWGQGKASGAEFELSAWWASTIQDGKVVRCFAYLDRDKALEAVGLSS